jgi:histidine kinase
VALAAVVDRVAAGMQPQLQERRLILTVNHKPHLPAALADHDRTIQIVANLLGNAVRYTPPGGRITLHTRQQVQPPALQVVVQDSGIGIDSADLPWLFERFYRAEPSRSRESGGLGLGLTIARRLARAMGGDIEAASPGPGQGSTFTLTLPLVAPSRIAP